MNTVPTTSAQMQNDLERLLQHPKKQVLTPPTPSASRTAYLSRDVRYPMCIPHLLSRSLVYWPGIRTRQQHLLLSGYLSSLILESSEGSSSGLRSHSSYVVCKPMVSYIPVRVSDCRSRS